MRLRVLHTLTLFLTAAVVASVLAMGSVLAWNLRNGFNDYIAARDSEHLRSFALFVGRAIARRGDSTLHPDDLGNWLRDFGSSSDNNLPPVADGMGGAHPPPGVGPRRADEPARGGAPLRAGGPPRAAGPPEFPGGRDALPARVSLLDPSGRHVAGPPLPAGTAAEVAPVEVAGRTVALLRLRARDVTGPGSDAVDVRFLRRQYLGIGAASALLILLAVAAAAWLARRWVQPLLDMQRVTARIAGGEPGLQLTERGSVEIADTIRNINSMAVSLQRLESARRRWLADISHELRTPLTVLRGELEAINDGVRPLDRFALASLREEVRRLGGLVDDLHLLAVSDLGGLPCHFSAVDPVALVRGAVQRFEPRARARQLALALELPDSAPEAHWDAMRIEQLCANLLENSLRYTDAPGQVRVRLEPAGASLVLQVDDTAPGVDPGQIAHLFEPLYRTAGARARETSGSGLGLAVAEAIVRAHGGAITAAPSALGGLRISATLPRNPRETT